MAYELKDGQGNLFPNNKSADNHPDFRGKLKTPDGKVWSVSAWNKTAQQTGNQFMSLAVQEWKERE